MYCAPHCMTLFFCPCFSLFSPSLMPSSSWPGDPSCGHPNPVPRRSFEGYPASAWTSAAGSGAGYGNHDVNKSVFGDNFLFQYNSGMPNHQPFELASSLPRVHTSPYSQSANEPSVISSSPTRPSQFMRSSAPVPVHHPSKRNGQHSGSATSAPRAISGKSDARRQKVSSCGG